MPQIMSHENHCEDVQLLKLEAKYLTYIVENHAELNILKHIESCPPCQKKIKESIADDTPLPEYGNLFQRQVEDETIPQYTDYKHVDNFTKARINWRRRRLQELIKEAEMELEDLRKRIR